MRCAALVSLGLLASNVHAWGSAGHEIVATIAQVHLTPNAREALCFILPDYAKCHLAPIASWADRVRNPATGPMHYVGSKNDWPPSNCSFDGMWENTQRNVLVGVRNSTIGVMSLVGEERDFALRYLVHFMGDLHMPLHLTGRDRGGNNNRVRFDRKITNLHSVWDSSLIAKALRSVDPVYDHPLPSKRIESALRGTIYDSYVRWITWEGIRGWWKEERASWLTCPEEPELEFEFEQTPSQLPLSGGPRLARFTRLAKEEDPVPQVCPLYWATNLHPLNCEYVWPPHLSNAPGTPPGPIPPKDLVQLDTPAYAGRIAKDLVIEKLMATAGFRLAAILNDLLDPEWTGIWDFES